MNQRLMIAAFAALLGSSSLHATERILVASTPQLEGNLVLRGPNLYTSTFNVSPPTFSTPDPVYEVSSSGTVSKYLRDRAAGAGQRSHLGCLLDDLLSL